MKSAKQKERELIIQLNNKKKTCREIAFDLNISKSKASFWINRFKKERNLADKPKSGCPTILSKNKLDEIYEEVKSQIKLKKNKSGTSTKEVKDIIEKKIGKKYSLRHVQRILHKIGFSLITPRVNHIKKNKEAQNKFRREFKKNSQKNIWVIPS